VTVACIGSSTTHGTGALSLDRGWTSHLSRRLGGQTLTALTHHPGWTTVGGSIEVEGGLSTRSRRLDPGATLTRTTTPCTAVQVLYRQLGGAFAVEIDGSQVRTVTPPAVTGDHYAGVLTIDGLPRAPHTLTLRAIGTTPTTISAVREIDGTAGAGVHVLNAAYAGTSSVTYSARTPGMRGHNRAVGAQDPALLIFMVGSNDYAAQVDPALYAEQMRAAVLAARAACPRRPSVLLVQSFKRFDVADPTHPWDAYGSALYDLAAALPDADYLDLSGHYPAEVESDDTKLISVDRIHQNDAGHAWMGDLVADHLLAPVPTAPWSDFGPLPDPDPATLPGLISAWNTGGLTSVPEGGETDWAPYAGTETASLTAPTGRRALVRRRGLAGRPTVVTQAGSPGRCLQTGAWSKTYDGPLTVLMVVKPSAASPHTQGGVLFSGRAEKYLGLSLAGDNLAQLLVGGVAAPHTVTGYLGTSSWKVLAVTHDSGAVALATDDGSKTVSAPGTAPGPDYGLSGFTIGGNTGMSSTLDADFAEVLVFDRALSPVETEQALRFLARKYRLDGYRRTS
jgi:lysophospholipase L1-like esterase